MLLEIYLVVLVIAAAMYIAGANGDNPLLIAVGSALFLIAGIYSFDLNVITDSGSVLQLEGNEWGLAFMWWGAFIAGLVYTVGVFLDQNWVNTFRRGRGE
jgi:hypothetical protein